MATAMVQLDEEALIMAEIDQIKLPKGMKFKRIDEINEYTGEPAWQLTFTTSTSIPLTKKRIREISAVHREAVDRVVALNLGKWAFFKLLEVK